MKKINLASILLILIAISILALSKNEEINFQNENFSINKNIIEINNETKHLVEIFVPAVDNQGKGVPVKLKVEALPGEGRILVNINQILFWLDTQQSIRLAKEFAEKYTNSNLSKVDLIYTIETDAQLIEGPSAGAALTIATIAVLENKEINKSVMITGTINPDGTIGPVGGILSKSNAAKEIGAKLFLVPKGQGIQTNYKPVQECKRLGAFTYCKIEYVPERVSVSESAGIEIREVERIEDALKYFLLN